MPLLSHNVMFVVLTTLCQAQIFYVPVKSVWLGGRVVRTLDTSRSWVPILAASLSIKCIHGHVVNSHVPLLQSSIIRYQPMAVMPCGWEGNRRSGDWPRVTDISGSPHTGWRPRIGRCAPTKWLKWGGWGLSPLLPFEPPAIVWPPDWVYKVLFYA